MWREGATAYAGKWRAKLLVTGTTIGCAILITQSAIMYYYEYGNNMTFLFYGVTIINKNLSPVHYCYDIANHSMNRVF